MSQLVDIGAAKEFMQATLERVSRNDLIAIAEDLERKSDYFRSRLLEDKIEKLTDADVDDILGLIFVARRRKKEIFEHNPPDQLRSEVTSLLYGESEVHERFQAFCMNLKGLDDALKAELAGELLHFTHPDRYWLWSRWMWDPGKKTGAIALVTSDEFDLQGETPGEVYMKVGKGVAFVHSVAEAAEFQFISRTLFGANVFLSCVYVVYAYTILRMRMTQEFNKVMPGLLEFTRRLLGVLKLPQEV